MNLQMFSEVPLAAKEVEHLSIVTEDCPFKSVQNRLGDIVNNEGRAVKEVSDRYHDRPSYWGLQVPSSHGNVLHFRGPLPDPLPSPCLLGNWRTINYEFKWKHQASA